MGYIGRVLQEGKLLRLEGRHRFIVLKLEELPRRNQDYVRETGIDEKEIGYSGCDSFRWVVPESMQELRRVPC